VATLVRLVPIQQPSRYPRALCIECTFPIAVDAGRSETITGRGKRDDDALTGNDVVFRGGLDNHPAVRRDILIGSSALRVNEGYGEAKVADHLGYRRVHYSAILEDARPERRHTQGSLRGQDERAQLFQHCLGISDEVRLSPVDGLDGKWREADSSQFPKRIESVRQNFDSIRIIGLRNE